MQSKQRKLATHMKTQKTNNLTSAKANEWKQIRTVTTTINNNKITGIINHWSLTSLNSSGLSYPIKRHRLTEWIQKQTLPQRKSQENVFQANGPKKQTDNAIVISKAKQLPGQVLGPHPQLNKDHPL